MERLNISKKEAEQVIRKEDRRRADNYRYYTGRVWGSAANVDLTFNTAMNEKYIEECISKAMELEIQCYRVRVADGISFIIVIGKPPDMGSPQEIPQSFCHISFSLPGQSVK